MAEDLGAKLKRSTLQSLSKALNEEEYSDGHRAFHANLVIMSTLIDIADSLHDLKSLFQEQDNREAARR